LSRTTRLAGAHHRRRGAIRRAVNALPGARGARRLLLHFRAGAEDRWDRSLLRLGPTVLELEEVRRRLEFLMAACYGRSIPIDAADSARHAGWLRRYVLRMDGGRAVSDAFPRTDGERIYLPRALDASLGEEAAVARYRLLAFEQAERIVRGTVAAMPGPNEHPLIRELYLLSEGAAVDARLAHVVSGIRPALIAARKASLLERPRFPYPLSRQRAVEALVRASLGAPPEAALVELPPAATPVDSLAWAHATARRLGTSVLYDRVRPVAHWGTVNPPPVWDPAANIPEVDEVLRNLVPRGPALPMMGIEAYGGDGTGDGAQLTPNRDGDVPTEQGEQASTGGGGSSNVGSQGTTTRSTASSSSEQSIDRDDGIHNDTPSARASTRVRASPPTAAELRYSEWDYVTARYREQAVTVHIGSVAEGASAWASALMNEHATSIRGIRQRFERLRAQRMRLRRQLDGEELDLEACVGALVDRRMGRSSDERLYTATRATRQPLAITLLVDVSGSTSSPVGESTRMIDVEKTALLLASEALAALGDRYSILSFTGRGAADVRVHTVKEFAETNGNVVRRRIAGLHPGGFTRLGAALRHASAELTRERVRHRLLLILSDGRPNDLGHYMADYGVEDSRQAINEARARGIHPFCLNVDPEGPEYLARIFGPVGYVTIRHPEQLPRALLQAVHTLIG
jgi:nitric oxide reductase NorD protein